MDFILLESGTYDILGRDGKITSSYHKIVSLLSNFVASRSKQDNYIENMMQQCVLPCVLPSPFQKGHILPVNRCF